MQPIEIRGLWWLPQSPDDRVAGIFRFDPSEGIRLDLIGTFDATPTIGVLESPPVVHGVGDRRLISLLGCQVVRSHFDVPSFATQSLVASHAFLGVHLDGLDDAVFIGIDVDLTYLADWFPSTGWEGEIATTPSSNLRSYSLKYTQPEPYEPADTPVGQLAPILSFSRRSIPSGRNVADPH